MKEFRKHATAAAFRRALEDRFKELLREDLKNEGLEPARFLKA